MSQIQRTHFTAGYTLYNYVCDKLKQKTIIVFLQNRYIGRSLIIGAHYIIHLTVGG